MFKAPLLNLRRPAANTRRAEYPLRWPLCYISFMLGKPLVCMALSSQALPSLAPLSGSGGSLFLPFLNHSAFYYLLRQCRQAGLDTMVVLLDEVLWQRLDTLKLLAAGLPLKIEWLPYAETAAWQAHILDLLNEEDPVLLWQNPALDLLPLDKLLAFHQRQQADVTLRISPTPDARRTRVWLDDENQLSLTGTERGGYDTRCYLIEPDIFEELLDAEPDLLRQPLLPLLQKAAEYLSGLLEDSHWAEWLEAQDYFHSQRQILQQQLFEPAHQRKLKLEKATVWLGEGVSIGARVSFTGPVTIGEGVSIGDDVSIRGPAVIGAGSQIQANSRIEASWLWPGCVIQRQSSISESWLGARVEIGANSRIKGLWAADGCRLSLGEPLPRGSRLGPGSRLVITRARDQAKESS